MDEMNRKDGWEEVLDGSTSVQSRDNYLTTYTTTRYVDYSHSYEAIILYIVKKAENLWENINYLNKKRIGQMFTLALMKYYCEQQKGYTKEKPIKVGKLRRYTGQIGFNAFDTYFHNLYDELERKEIEYTNKHGEIDRAYIFETNINMNEIRSLVDDREMIRILDDVTKKGQFKSVLEKSIRNTFKRLDIRYKIKHGEE